MKVDQTHKVIRLAVVSRMLCIALAILGYASSRLEYQRSTILLGADPSPKWLYRLVGPFLQWDALHFLNIATRGYDSVLEHAFFPGLPIVMRLLSCIIPSFSDNPMYSLAFGGILFVQVSFVVASVGLYKVSLHFCSDGKTAYRATLLYVFASCSIFLCAVYTEAPFSMLTFWGLYCLYVRNDLMLSSLMLSIAGLFRSNGILAIVYVLHFACIRKDRSAGSIFQALLASGAIYVPYLVYSLWSRNLYCELTETPHEWCSEFSSIYGYVQNNFWGVSFMSYWKVNNIPQFLLMTPTLLVTLHAPMHYWLNSIGRKGFNLHKLILNPIAPFLVHMGALTAFVVFIANCQILTRILSSCPLYFWTLERVLRDVKTSRISQFLAFMHLLYFIIGPVLFASGLNWT
jgi:phosphatidylinositol glycan class V